MKTRSSAKNLIFSGCFCGCVEQLWSSFSSWKNISKCLKQQSSDTITENQQYDVYKWRQMLDIGHGMKQHFFWKGSSDHVKQL